MTDEELIRYLVATAAYVSVLHERSRSSPAVQVPREDIRDWVDEGFARWMGWRGEDEQEREIRNVRNQGG